MSRDPARAPRTLDDLDLAGKRAIVRADLNAPLSQDGSVADDSRIRAAAPTIRTVLDAGGTDVGNSLVEDDKMDAARQLADEAQRSGAELILPVDVVVARDTDSREHRTVPVDAVPRDWMILDIGEETTGRIVEAVNRARTVVWNGPVGAAEHGAFAGGTARTADAIAQRTTAGRLTSAVGGGDTVAVLSRMSHAGDFTHASLAGGAFLAWLKGERLPGVAALEESRQTA